MASTVGVFDVDIGPKGALIITAGSQMLPHWLCDEEVDAGIQALKDDLDAVAIRAKAAIRAQKLIETMGRNTPRAETG
jgi:hypothetical protein